MLRSSFLVAVLLSVSVLSAAPKAVDGKVSRVTLYRGQALVTRTVQVDGKKGGVEVVVGGLPENVLSDSLFAEGGDAVEVRAVQFRSRAVGEEPREEVRQLDEAIDGVAQKIELNRKNQELLKKRSAYLDGLEGFVAPTAKTELSKGVLDVEALERITKFSFEQRKAITEEQVKLEAEARTLQEEQELLQRKRAELTNGSSRTVREAVLFLQKHNDDAAEVRLNYLVNNCGWSPSYTMRAGNDQKQVQVEYNALIQQMSGEDWSNVTLTLSTASPALSSSRPGLAPFRVALQGAPQQGGKLPNQDAQQLVQQLKTRQYQAIISNRNTFNFRDNTSSSWSLNGIACEIQRLELTGDEKLVSSINMDVGKNGEGPSLSYKLAGPVSLPSRIDQQMVRIMQTDFPSTFYYVATPVLTSYVYREAELSNTCPEDLLAGPITVYLDGRFVGRGEIPTVARGQKFLVGFGADPQLRARRELADRKDGVQGGNRELEFSYRLMVENYKGEATPLRVMDRLPSADRKADIRVSLGEMSDELAEDKLYERRERPRGILRWDIDVPASATGANARLINYTYTVEYDRNFHLNSPSAQQQMQQEFEQLERARMKL